MQLFFAASGAAGSIALVLKSAPSLFLFSVVQILVHFLILMALGNVFRVDIKNLLLSSNANIGKTLRGIYFIEDAGRMIPTKPNYYLSNQVVRRLQPPWLKPKVRVLYFAGEML